LGAVIAYLLVHAVLEIQSVLTLMLLALVIAVSVEPVVAWLTAKGMRRRWAVTSAVIGLLLVVGALFSLFVPPVISEVNALVKAVPTWLQQLHDHHSFLGRLEDRYHLIAKAKRQLSGGGTAGILNGLLGAGQLLLTTLTGLVLVITLTLYFLAGLPTLKRFCLRFVPGSKRDRTQAMTDEILIRTGRYMLANVATSGIAGLATLIWLEIWGVPYPAALGGFVAVMDMIPVIGSTIGGIVVSFVALVVSFPVALATAAFYVVFRLAEDYLIVPRAMKYAVAVHPLVTILAILAGGALLGVVGALIAIPVAVAVGLLLDEAVFPRIAAR
jgi:predicted PurR-regulated permease PerM